MKNTIRCCISCIFPCGSLDVIRIVHVNGRVEEISGSIKASDIMKAHPKHILKKPSSSSSSTSSEDQGCCPKIVVVPPDAELQRGKIYFLIPVPPSASANSQKNQKGSRSRSSSSSSSSTRRKKRETAGQKNANNANNNNSNISVTNLLISDRYLTEILSEKISTQRDRRRGRAGIWRPHLESICETSSEA